MHAFLGFLVGVCVFSMLLHASLCLYFRILCQVKHLESSLLDSCIRCVLTTGNAPPGLGDRWHLGAHRGFTESLAGHDADPADLDFWTSLMSRAANVRCCCGTSESLPNLCDSFEDFGQLGMCSSSVFTGEKNPKVTLSSFILTAVIICGIVVVLVIQRVSTWPKHLGQHWRIRCEHHAVT